MKLLWYLVLGWYFIFILAFFKDFCAHFRTSHSYSICHGIYTRLHCDLSCVHSLIAQLPNGPRKNCYHGGADAISQGLRLRWSSMRHAKFLHPPRLSPHIHPGISCLFDFSHYVSFLLQAYSSETIMKKKNLKWYYIFTPLTIYTMNTIVTMGHSPMGPAYSQALSLILRYTMGQRLIPQLQIHYIIMWANETHMKQPITDLTELLNLLGKYFFGVTCMPCDKLWVRKCLLSKIRKSGIYLRALMLDSMRYL